MKKKSLHNGFLESVYPFLKGLREHEITLAFEGEIDHEAMKTFTNMAEGRLSKESENETVVRKVYHVMVECLQNISKHAYHGSESNSERSNHGVLVVSRNEKEYFVTTGNAIESNHVPGLEDLLKEINAMDQGELDKSYKKQLKEGHLSEKGGAGLGFIDIRRKTRNGLEYHFLPLEAEYTLFLLTSKISRT